MTFFGPDHVAKLKRIAEATNSPLPSAFIDSCESFLGQLVKWNRQMNLISARDEPRLVERHVLDSLCLLSIENRLAKKRILDVGTGAGFPGMVLALWERRAEVILLESRMKPVAFLKSVRRGLGLNNVEIVHDRLESVCEKKEGLAPVDIVTSRAVGRPLQLARVAKPLLKSGGTVIFYGSKGLWKKDAAAETPRDPGFTLERKTPAWQTLTTLLVLRKTD
jgi:16S rRNA (guanine527-N7)-methyltransferase